jgi:prefoldin subunit 5
MTNEDLLQKTLNATIERLGRQAINYEAEIANLNSQIAILSSQVEELKKSNQDKPLKVSPAKE